MISAVLFDLDETLLDRTGSLTLFLADQFDRFRERLGAASAVTWRDTFLALDARGHTSKSIVYPQLLARFGGDPAAAQILLEDYQLNCSRLARSNDGMEETLVSLRRRGLALGIITNGEAEFQSRHIDALNLRALVNVILISETEGLRKPDVAIFMRAARRLSVDPAQCLFVGDNPTVDILGAHSAGMQTAWFRSGHAWPDDHFMPCPSIESLSDVLTLLDRTRQAFSNAQTRLTPPSPSP